MLLLPKKGSRYSVAVTLLVLVAFTHPVFATENESSVRYDSFDKTLTKKVSSYAIGAWIRPSMSIPSQVPENFFQKSTLILGLSNSKNGWTEKADRYDHFVALFMTSIDNYQNFILRFDNNQQFRTIPLSINPPYFGYWFYVQLVYDAGKKAIFLNIQRQGDTNFLSEEFKAENRNDYQNLNFSVSRKEGGYYAQFNGDLEQVEFTSDPNHKLLDSKVDFISLMKSLPAPKNYNLLPQDSVTKLVSGTISDAIKKTFLINPGTRPYSINLLIKFATDFNPKKIYQILRFGSFENTPVDYLDMQTDKIRAFKIETFSLKNGVGAPQKMEIIFKKVKFDKNDQLDISFAYFPKELEFWVRMKNQKDKYYETYLIDDVIKPDITQLIFYANEVGEKTNFQIDSNFYGQKGADWARQQNYFDRRISAIWDGTLKRKYVPYEMINFFLSSSSEKEPNSFYGSGDQITGSNRVSTIHFWYRRDINEPSFSDLDIIRSSDLSIVSFTESKYDEIGNIVEIFEIYYRSHLNQKNPAYIFKTVNMKTKKKVEQSFVIDITSQQAQNEWHLFFISISFERQEIFFAVNLNGKIITNLQKDFFLEQNDVIANLGVSDSQESYRYSAPGEFFNFQFITSNSNKLQFINNLDLFNKYSATYCFVPQARVGKSLDIPFTDLNLPFQTISPSLFKYSKAYSVSVWARWNESNSDSISQNTIFQLSINKVRVENSTPRLGDNALHVFVNQTSVVFNTYSMGFLPEQDVSELQKSIPYNFSSGQWCFFYFGYDSTLQTATGFINCDDGVVEKVVFESVTHISPTEGYVQLGDSYNYQKLVGEVHYPVLSANTAIKVDTEIPKNLLEFKPPKQIPKCTTFYQNCNFKKVLASACKDLPAIDLSKIRSIFLPESMTIKIFKQQNFNGLNLKIKKSVDCFENSLSGTKDLKWEALSTFFNEGVLSFTNESGDEIPIEDAKAIFFSPSESDSSTPSLRRHILRKEQDSISDNDFGASTSVTDS